MALSLLPLLAFYALSKRRRFSDWGPFLLIPLAALGLKISTFRLYGSGLLSEAAAYSRQSGAAVRLLAGLLIGLTFLGGCFVPAFFYAPLLWSRRALMLLGGLAALCLLPVVLSERIGWFPLNATDGFRWGVIAQMGFFVFGGVSLLATMAAINLWRIRDAETWLLALWCGGTFLFASIFNWTVNGRSLLPLTPAAAILLVRRLDVGRGWVTARSAAALGLPLLLSALVGFGVTWADFQLANSARLTVEALKPEFPAESSRSGSKGIGASGTTWKRSGPRP